MRILKNEYDKWISIYRGKNICREGRKYEVNSWEYRFQMQRVLPLQNLVNR